jgi:hypothetical protein
MVMDPDHPAYADDALGAHNSEPLVTDEVRPLAPAARSRLLQLIVEILALVRAPR